MRSKFPLFNTPIDLAHHFWKELLTPGDVVIDATCGNGKDSLVLATLLQPLDGKLFCIDIQEKAIENTKSLLHKEKPEFFSFVRFYHRSHENLPKLDSVKLIVFNLGYLPAGDKSITTKVDATLQSIKNALEVLCLGGVLSITCYPGHIEGKKEEQVLLDYLSKLDPFYYCFTSFFWGNRNASPSLFLVQKKSSI
jgi:SAM-dependent methyltransferase